jgi:hypothetical protein
MNSVVLLQIYKVAGVFKLFEVFQSDTNCVMVTQVTVVTGGYYHAYPEQAFNW